MNLDLMTMYLAVVSDGESSSGSFASVGDRDNGGD